MLVDVVTEFADRGGPPRRRRGRRGVRGARRAAQGQPRDRAADPGRARGARRHLRGALGDGRHPRRRGAGQGRHGPGRRRASLPAPSPPRSSLWGTDEQQQTYLPAFTGDEVPAAALALDRAGRPLRRRCQPATTADASSGDGYVAQRRQVPGRPRRRGRAVRRRRDARRQAGAVPGRVVHRGPHHRGRPVDGRPRGAPDAAAASRTSTVAAERGARRDRRHDVRRVRAAVAPRLVRARGRHRPGRARLRDAVRQGARGVR